MRLAMFSILASVFLMPALPALAGPLESGVAAQNGGDYATALRLLSPLAEQGNAIAQFNLATMYDLAQGVPQDYAEATKWLRKSADQGIAAAQTRLGVMYLLGNGVQQDYAEALKWFRQAANQDSPSGQKVLGNMYANGLGVQQDYAAAYVWFSLAAAMGDEDAASARDTVAAHMSPDQIAEAQRLAAEWKPMK